MLARTIVAVSAMLSLPILATAAAVGDPLGSTDSGAGSCSTGSLQCCQTVANSNDPNVSDLLSLLGVVVQGVDAAVGLNCDPITAIGVGISSQCQAHAVCCPDNDTGGVVSVGCVPVSL
ncbi:fungal hydrophobin [Ganoderma leucocontextum]|nr:fungal hydrophobin [Ganoderma leucocontextum]